MPAVRREAEPGDSARRHRILAGVVAGISRLGARLPEGGAGGFVMGLGLGLLFVPSGGPVLAAITVARATHQVGLTAVALTLAFAAGATVPLMAVAIAGSRLQRCARFVGKRSGSDASAG